LIWFSLTQSEQFTSEWTVEEERDILTDRNFVDVEERSNEGLLLSICHHTKEEPLNERLTKESSAQQVAQWFTTYGGGMYSKYADLFTDINGTELLGFSKKDLREFLGNVPKATALHNALHLPQTPTGTPSLQFVFIQSLLFCCLLLI